MVLDKFDKVDKEEFIRVWEMFAANDPDYCKGLQDAKLMNEDNKLTEQGRMCLFYLLKHHLKDMRDERIEPNWKDNGER